MGNLEAKTPCVMIWHLGVHDHLMLKIKKDLLNERVAEGETFNPRDFIE
jgi:hypothetical protein